MKKGYFEIKRWNSDIDTFEVYFVEKQRFTATRQDLKDLRSLIDTVLGQPLTEGEGEEFPLNNVVGLPIGEDVIVKLEDGRIIEGTIKTRTQQESNKEEVRIGATGKPPFGLYEEPSKKEEEVPQKILINGDIIGICKKGFRVTKEECIGCERGVKHVCIPEPSKKPICYCGHPKERHFIQYKSLVEGNQLSCRHCECFEYADNELHNQGEI